MYMSLRANLLEVGISVILEICDLVWKSIIKMGIRRLQIAAPGNLFITKHILQRKMQ